MAETASILSPQQFRSHVDAFNAADVEDIANIIPNADSFAWMRSNVPYFDCPDAELTKIYYYRWWTYRKHLKETPAGTIVTEFISQVKHAGAYNSISCALGFHLAEGRWMHEQRYLNEYTNFWFTAGENGTPEPKFHNYSSWFPIAALERFFVNNDRTFLVGRLDRFIEDYHRWEAEKQLPNGLFWQFDVRDGMEESITGSRKHKNARPTINTYMYANALAIAEVAKMANRPDVVTKFESLATTLKQLTLSTLWDANAKFFKAQKDEAGLSDAREAIGFVPWQFRLPDAGRGYEDAWRQLVDPEGFWAPRGITTAERRHPLFRSHGVGKCEWDGAAWPFATSQTLYGLANVLRHYEQSYVSRQTYFDAMRIYANAHHWEGREPYIGEYHDEITGAWLKGPNPRSRYYNHSTFCDLVITGLVGLVPRSDDTIEVDPLLPDGAWDYFALDHVRYHGHDIAIVWDRVGDRYGLGPGLRVLVDGQVIAHSPTLHRVEGQLPA